VLVALSPAGTNPDPGLPVFTRSLRAVGLGDGTGRGRRWGAKLIALCGQRRVCVKRNKVRSVYRHFSGLKICTVISLNLVRGSSTLRVWRGE
jgi:hypothetical protein